MAAWRETGRSVKIAFIGDARLLSPFGLLVFFPSWWILGLCAVSTVLLVLLNYKGYSFPVFKRWLRTKLIGKVRLSRSAIKNRRFYGKANPGRANLRRWH
ncbi:IcmT/TraK family protein [Methylobacillus sp. Pita2]|uniref:IcmT/TraK family protein n=1 Tax=Methylobacillus sp. Pita2 TaxID=3383245 RepID=UPI0038B5655F